MKKSFLIGALVALAMTFVGCFDGIKTDTPAEETPAGPTLVQVIDLKTFFSWSELNITADNAGDYIFKATYTLTDDTKVGYGPVGVCNSSWGAVDELNALFNVNADGVNEVEVSAVIAKLPDGVLFNFWGGDYASDYKIELFKK